MLNKLQLNNLIISNKKKIQQGRTQTINKVVQKIRKLKAQLEKHPDNPKIKERLRKTSENLEYLKKLKCFDAVKKILLLEKNPSTIITNGLSTPEEVAIALLAQNKVIQDLIIMFKEQLNLTDTDLKWKEELLEPSKRRAKIDRTEEKKKKRKDVKEQKANERKRIDWIKENNPYMEEDVGLSATGAWKIEPIEADIEHSSVSINVPNMSRKPLIADNELSESEMEIDAIENVKPIKELKSKMLPRAIDRNTKTKPKKGNTLIADNDLSESEMEIDLAENVKPKKELKSKMLPRAIDGNTKTKKKKVNTLIADNELSESEMEIDSTDNVKSKNGTIKSKILTRAIVENTKTKQNKVNNDIKSKLVKSSMNSTTNSDESYKKIEHVRKIVEKEETEPIVSFVVDPFFITETGENYVTTTVTIPDKTANEIAAKKEENVKKEETYMIGNRRTRRLLERGEKPDEFKSTRNRAHGKHENGNDKSLHPSWTAKQKLKPVITSFQGKKITFDDDDINGA